MFFSLACLALLLTSRLLPPGGIPGVDLCAFHAATGLPCPGCGLTRAFCALSRGQFLDAWTLHPFAFPLYAATLGGVAAPLVARRCPGFGATASPRTLQALALALAAGLLLFGAWRAGREWRQLHAPATVSTMAATTSPQGR